MLWWIFANSMSFTIGWTVSLTINFFVGLSLIGALLGVVQWRVAYQKIEWISLWWLVATFIGWTVGSFAGVFLGLMSGDPTSNWDVVNAVKMISVFGGTSGAGLGVGQWFFMRRKIAYAHWWIIANIVGWSLGSTIAVLSKPFAEWIAIFESEIEVFGFLIATGAIAGIITGGTLVWLVQKNAYSLK